MDITILKHTDKKDGVHWQFGQDIQIDVLRPKCRTSIISSAGKPCNIIISANETYGFFHRTSVCENGQKPYIIWESERCIKIVL